jgi:hypothetical protein
MRIWNDFFSRENGFSSKSSTPRFTLVSKVKEPEAVQHLDEKKTLLVLGLVLGKKNESIEKEAKKITSQMFKLFAMRELYFEDI